MDIMVGRYYLSVCILIQNMINLIALKLIWVGGLRIAWNRDWLIVFNNVTLAIWHSYIIKNSVSSAQLLEIWMRMMHGRTVGATLSNLYVIQKTRHASYSLLKLVINLSHAVRLCCLLTNVSSSCFQCMCSDCAKELRLQSNKCPICRQPISELIEIKINNTTTAQWSPRVVFLNHEFDYIWWSKCNLYLCNINI